MYRTVAQIRNLKSLFSNPKAPPSQISLFHSSTILNNKIDDSEKPVDDDNNDNKVSLLNRDPDSPPKLLVVQPRLRPDSVLKLKLGEALNLANSLEERRDGCTYADMSCKDKPPHIIVQNPAVRSDKLKSATYFGMGTVETIKSHLDMIESESEVDAVFINAKLSGVQHRNLEVILEKPILDRVALIIEIFNAHANTKEAKLQAELAALMYKKSRLVRARGPDGRSTFGASGESQVVSARGRGSGGIGFIGGAGESELQLQRRRISERRDRLLSLVKAVQRTRALHRASRKRNGSSNGQDLATVAIVGYTNAGKSTLINTLSDADLYSDDRMFATLDPRLRSVELPSGRKVLLSDTVGFISDLPIQLVKAFHATLEEVVEADLLVHVLDSSAPDLDAQRSTVLQVLEQIGVSEEKLSNMIEVWNKIDLQDKDNAAGEYLDVDGGGFSEVEDEERASDNEASTEETYSFFVEEDDEASTDETIYDDYVQQCNAPSSGLSTRDEQVTVVSQQRELQSEAEREAKRDKEPKPKSWYEVAQQLKQERERITREATEQLKHDRERITREAKTIEVRKPSDDEFFPDMSSFLDEDEREEKEREMIDKAREAYNSMQGEEAEEKDLKSITGKGSNPQTAHAAHVKTSGLTGIGLQELLLLIDEKLKTDKVVERGIFDRKWRPPRKDDDIAAKQ